MPAHLVGRRFNHRLGAVVGQMRQPERRRVGSSGVGQFVHKRFDGKDVGIRPQAAEGGGAERAVGNVVGNDPLVGKIVERVGVAIAASMVAQKEGLWGAGKRPFSVPRRHQPRTIPHWPGATHVGVAPHVMVPVGDVAVVERRRQLHHHRRAIRFPTVFIVAHPF